MQNSAITVARVADSLRSTTAQFVRRAGTRTREESAPELPLWQPTDEGSELVIALRRELRSHILGATLEFVSEQVILQGWVEFRLQEGKEEVEEVYCVCVWAQNVNMGTIHLVDGYVQQTVVQRSDQLFTLPQ